MSLENVFTKDPDATLDYGFDWVDWLPDGETISSYVITTSSSGITKVTDLNTAGSVVVWLSGGTVGKRYAVTCQITTTGCPARIDERTINIDIRDR